MEHLHALLSFSFIAPHKYPPWRRSRGRLRFCGMAAFRFLHLWILSLTPPPHGRVCRPYRRMRTASSSTSILPKARPSSSRRWPRRRTPLAPLPGLRPHPLHGNQRRALLHSERKRQGHHGRRPHQSRLRGRCGSAESQGDDRAGGGGAENIVKALLKSEIDVLPCTGFHYNKITDASIHPPATPRLPQR